jgi:hypothetical protein
MADLKDPKAIYAKGFLFLLGGLLASFILVLENPSLKTALLIAIAVWCFARFYYFAFYVIEHYVDPGFRFAGLWSFARYLMRRRAPEVRPANVVEPQADALTPPAPETPAPAPPARAAPGGER